MIDWLVMTESDSYVRRAQALLARQLGPVVGHSVRVVWAPEPWLEHLRDVAHTGLIIDTRTDYSTAAPSVVPFGAMPRPRAAAPIVLWTMPGPPSATFSDWQGYFYRAYSTKPYVLAELELKATDRYPALDTWWQRFLVARVQERLEPRLGTHPAAPLLLELVQCANATTSEATRALKLGRGGTRRHALRERLAAAGLTRSAKEVLASLKLLLLFESAALAIPSETTARALRTSSVTLGLLARRQLGTTWTKWGHAAVASSYDTVAAFILGDEAADFSALCATLRQHLGIESVKSASV